MSQRRMGDFQEWFSTCQAAVITTECGSSDIIKLPVASVTYRWHLTVCQVTFDLFVQFVIMLSLFPYLLLIIPPTLKTTTSGEETDTFNEANNLKVHFYFCFPRLFGHWLLIICLKWPQLLIWWWDRAMSYRAFTPRLWWLAWFNSGSTSLRAPSKKMTPTWG